MVSTGIDGYGINLDTKWTVKDFFAGGNPARIPRIVARLARPHDTDLPVYVCRAPDSALRALWPELRRFSHVERPLRGGRSTSHEAISGGG